MGSIGLRHLRCFQATGRAELSLCEVDAGLRERVAGEYGVRRAYADLDAALGDRHDAAVIATPAHLHVPMGLRLAEAGVHLLIEKPLSTSLDGIGDAGAGARPAATWSAAVAYVLRQHPALCAMSAAIRSGRFGRPVELVAVAGQNFPTYRPAYREIYYKDRATGGGAIQDALTHAMNAAEWLVGPVDRLAADAAHQVLEGVEVEDTVHVIARHGDLLASYSLNQHQAPNELTLTVVCQGGTCRWELHRQRWRWMTRPDAPWEEESFAGLRARRPVRRPGRRVPRRARGPGRAGLHRSAEAAQTLRCNLAALASAEQGTWKRTSDA